MPLGLSIVKTRTLQQVLETLRDTAAKWKETTELLRQTTERLQKVQEEKEYMQALQRELSFTWTKDKAELETQLFAAQCQLRQMGGRSWLS